MSAFFFGSLLRTALGLGEPLLVAWGLASMPSFLPLGLPSHTYGNSLGGRDGDSGAFDPKCPCCGSRRPVTSCAFIVGHDFGFEDGEKGEGPPEGEERQERQEEEEGKEEQRIVT